MSQGITTGKSVEGKGTSVSHSVSICLTEASTSEMPDKFIVRLMLRGSPRHWRNLGVAVRSPTGAYIVRIDDTVELGPGARLYLDPVHEPAEENDSAALSKGRQVGFSLTRGVSETEAIDLDDEPVSYSRSVGRLSRAGEGDR